MASVKDVFFSTNKIKQLNMKIKYAKIAMKLGAQLLKDLKVCWASGM